MFGELNGRELFLQAMTLVPPGMGMKPIQAQGIEELSSSFPPEAGPEHTQDSRTLLCLGKLS